MPLVFKFSNEELELVEDSLFDDELDQEDNVLEPLDLEQLLTLDPNSPEMEALAEIVAGSMGADSLDLQGLLEKLREVRDKYHEDDNEETPNPPESA